MVIVRGGANGVELKIKLPQISHKRLSVKVDCATNLTHSEIGNSGSTEASPTKK